MAIGAVGLAGAAACAGAFFSEELATAWSGAFLQEAKHKISKQERIAKVDFLIIGKRLREMERSPLECTPPALASNMFELLRARLLPQIRHGAE